MAHTGYEFETIDLETLLTPGSAELELEEEATIVSADSTAATKVVPAAACQIPKSRSGSFIARAASSITHVVLHTIEGNYAHAIGSWKNGTSCFKPHYVARNDGEITQIVAERFIAQHANRANPYSIGIEQDGFSSKTTTFTEAMYESVARLVRDICTRYSIPMDRAHIIGHEDAPGTTHGDPGGYFDWDYFIALVNWNGSAASRPVRIVVDAMSYSAWPLSSTSTAWTLVERLANTRPPHPKHSWGTKAYRASASPTDHDPVVFLGSVPAVGSYELSAWWPIASGNCAAVTMSAFVDGSGTAAVTTTVDQSTLRGMTRRTLALPHTPQWRSLGTLTMRAGSSFWVEVSRRSTKRGVVFADAIKLLRR
jgi:hypothetical protein